MKAFLIASLLLAASFVPGGARAHHSGTCSIPSGTPSLAVNGAPVSGVVEPDKTDRYKLVLSDASEHYLVVQPLNGDVWVQVCKVGQLASQHACLAGNMGVLPELCAVDGVEGNPGAGPPLRGAGTYLVMVKHCFRLDQSKGDCDYSSGVAPAGTVPGVPIAYGAFVLH